jgi:hypothetical protein
MTRNLARGRVAWYASVEIERFPLGWLTEKAYHAVFGTGMRERTLFVLAHGEVVRDI